MVRHGAGAGLGRGDRVPGLRRSRHAGLRSDRAYAFVRMTPGRPPTLDISGLRKSFHHVEVLRGIDLAVSSQELVFIIGPSGSGKSTLLRCCNRLEEPTAGSIRIDGIDRKSVV